MKKLKLNAINLKADDLLSREQLRNVLGGDDISSTGGDCQEYLEACDTSSQQNCCNSLTCADHKCYYPTI